MIEWLKDALEWFLKTVLEIFSSLFNWVWDSLTWVISKLITLAPSVDLDISQVQQYFDIMNAWLPMAEVIGIYVLYLVFYPIMIGLDKMVRFVDIVWP